jgi:hypothetical protein
MARGLVKKFRERREKRRADRKAETALGEQLMEENRDIGRDFMTRDYVDPVGQAAQQQALDRYSQLATTGFTDADRLAQQQANNEAARYEQAQREGIAQDARMRGMSGSGMEMASQLAAQQGGADRAQEMQTAIAREARDRSLGATDAMAELGGNLVGQGMQAGGMQMQGGQMLGGANSVSSAYHLEQGKSPWDKVVDTIQGVGTSVGNIYSSFASGGDSGGGGAAKSRTAAPSTTARTATPTARTAAPTGTPAPAGFAPPAQRPASFGGSTPPAARVQTNTSTSALPGGALARSRARRLRGRTAQTGVV